MNKRTPHGFSLIEVLVATALLSVAGLSAAYVAQQSTDMQLLSKQDEEINKKMERIENLLRDTRPCEATLVGRQPGDAITFMAGTALSATGAILPSSTLANEIYNLPDYEPDLAQISSATLTNHSLNLGGGKVAKVIQIDFLRRSGPLNNTTVRRQLTVNVGLAASGAVNRCFSEVELSLSAACRAIGGNLAFAPPSSYRCQQVEAFGNMSTTGDLKTTTGGSRTNTLQVDGTLAAGNNSAVDRVAISGDVRAEGRVVIGGSATSAQASGNVVSAPRVCIGGNCRTLGTTSCPGGQYMYGLSNSGNAMCAPIPPAP